MYFETLPTEIVTHIFLSIPTVSSAIALSSTCHRFRNTYHSSKKLVILAQAAEAEYGPLSDIIQLVTHNASQPAHTNRSVPMSDALLHQIVKVGRTAQRWESIYPSKKWKSNYEDRRNLNSTERHALRRAIYRLWLFAKAFHNAAHTRTQRATPEARAERTRLLQNYSTPELAELLDTQNILREVVGTNICPSNGTVRRKYQKRHPDATHQLLFNIHLNYPPTSSLLLPETTFHTSPASAYTRTQHSKYHSTPYHDPGAEGWGDDILHYYVVEDMMKLDPGQIIYLKENCAMKMQVEAFAHGLGDWFGNNGETFSETLGAVVRGRGVELQEFRTAVLDGEIGVVGYED